MSQIAAALARSKGKKVGPVPSQESVVPAIHTSVPPMPARLPGPVPRKNPLVLAALASGAALILLVAGWWMVRPAAPPPAAAPARPVAAAVATPVPSKPAALPAERPLPAPTLDLRMPPEVEDQLRKLNISARRSGNGPRIVVGGKVFEPGDTVIPGVVLDSVMPDRVVFRNAENQRFERRF